MMSVVALSVVYFDLSWVVLRSLGSKEASLNTFSQPNLIVMGCIITEGKYIDSWW